MLNFILKIESIPNLILRVNIIIKLVSILMLLLLTGTGFSLIRQFC